MTEDEAFIRTIVDRPGDDLPRLVYADWLDERNDPRGTYLRAELEWAKTKQTTGFLLLRLHSLAEQLDPVWVARVSRPLMGVCCDHLKFIQGEPPASDVDIAEMENEYHVVLSPHCRAFLLNHNGGEPVGEGLILDTPDGGASDNPNGWWFHPLRRAGGTLWGESSIRGALLERSRQLLPSQRGTPSYIWSERYLAIGRGPPDDGEFFDTTILLVLSGSQAGEVWISSGHELDDPNFDVEHPHGIHPLPYLLSQIR